MTGGLAKPNSGDIRVVRTDGPNPGGVMSPPGPGGGGPASGGGGSNGMTNKGSGNITVDRSVTMPPTKAPAK